MPRAKAINAKNEQARILGEADLLTDKILGAATDWNGEFSSLCAALLRRHCIDLAGAVLLQAPGNPSKAKHKRLCERRAHAKQAIAFFQDEEGLDLWTAPLGLDARWVKEQAEAFLRRLRVIYEARRAA